MVGLLETIENCSGAASINKKGNGYPVILVDDSHTIGSWYGGRKPVEVFLIFHQQSCCPIGLASTHCVQHGVNKKVHWGAALCHKEQASLQGACTAHECRPRLCYYVAGVHHLVLWNGDGHIPGCKPEAKPHHNYLVNGSWSCASLS